MGLLCRSSIESYNKNVFTIITYRYFRGQNNPCVNCVYINPYSLLSFYSNPGTNQEYFVHEKAREESQPWYEVPAVPPSPPPPEPPSLPPPPSTPPPRYEDLGFAGLSTAIEQVMICTV